MLVLTPAEGAADLPADRDAAAVPARALALAGAAGCERRPAVVAELVTAPWVLVLVVAGVRAPCVRNGIIA